MVIREALHDDREGILALHRAAFPADESEVVAQLAVDLLALAEPRVLNLVAEDDGGVVGHVAFSPVTLETSDGESTMPTGAILAPLGVHPDHQGRHVGKRLIETGQRRLRDDGAAFLLVYGDPAYYGRFGFDRESADRFLPPYELEHPFGWQAVALGEDDMDRPAATIRCVEPLNDPSLW